MSVQLQSNLDLAAPDVVEWILRNDGTPYRQPIDPARLPYPDLFEQPGTAVEVAADRPEAERLVATYTGRYQDWAIILKHSLPGGARTESVVAEFTICGPVEHNLLVGAETVLFVNEAITTLDMRQRIRDAYLAFDQHNDDPILYFAQKAGEIGCPSYACAVAMRATLTRVGGPTETLIAGAVPPKTYLQGQIETLQSQVFAVGGPANPKGDAALHLYELRLLKEYDLGEVTTRDEDPIREFGATNESEVDDGIDAAAEELIKEVDTERCGQDYYKESRRIMTVLAWPEFKVEWYYHTIRITRCVTIIIKLPLLRTRRGEKRLYAQVSVSKKGADATLVSIVVNCAVVSAGVGTVVGVVLQNFEAALLVFVELFNRCVIGSLVYHTACIVPTLMLVTYRSEWT